MARRHVLVERGHGVLALHGQEDDVVIPELDLARMVNGGDAVALLAVGGQLAQALLPQHVEVGAPGDERHI